PDLKNLFPTTKTFLLLGNGKETENKLIDSYRTKVLQNLGKNEVFWTEADGGNFISLKNAYFFEERDHIIADILSKHGIPTVKMDKNKLSYLSEKIGQKSIKYQSIKFSEILRENGNILRDIAQEQNDFANIIKLAFKNRSFGTFGERDYYIADKRYQELFPISGILDLFTEELPNKQQDWDPSSKANPYQQWLGDVFKIMKLGPGLELPNCPLLPIIQLSHKLVNLDLKTPLFINPDNNIPAAFIVDVLVKLGFCFTDIKFPALKRYVKYFNYSTVFNSINQVSQSQDISIKNFFNNAKLDDDDYLKLRKYVKSFIDVAGELPIWPIRSSRKYKFISANDKGILPPNNLSCPLQDTDIFYVQNDYYNVLISLGVEKVEVYDFVKKYYSHGSDERIESYLKSREAIPNKSLKEFVKANTLFDAEMGLQRDLNGSTYLEYAHEIQEKINNNDDEIRSRAIKLIERLN
ncbi:13789_t:CDS:2, partial [Gigaspora rosea]